MARNRVTPTGEIVDSPLRGQWMGNRGVLHRGTTVVRPWANRRWIICRLAWKDWRAAQWADGRYTVLFFHDEAVALAAGHRPCALCRHAAYRAFLDASGSRSADELDRALHADRVDGRVQQTHRRPWAELPDGAFVAGPAVVQGDRLVPWNATTGYGAATARPTRGDATVLTPSLTIDVLASVASRLD